MVTGQTVQRNVGSFDDIRKTLDGPPPGNVVVGTSGATEKQPDDVAALLRGWLVETR